MEASDFGRIGVTGSAGTSRRHRREARGARAGPGCRGVCPHDRRVFDDLHSRTRSPHGERGGSSRGQTGQVCWPPWRQPAFHCPVQVGILASCCASPFSRLPPGTENAPSLFLVCTLILTPSNGHKCFGDAHVRTGGPALHQRVRGSSPWRCSVSLLEILVSGRVTCGFVRGVSRRSRRRSCWRSRSGRPRRHSRRCCSPHRCSGTHPGS